MHTTQFAFTREALAVALLHLTANGHLVIFGASKTNLVLSLRALGETHLADRVMLFESVGDPDWKRGWDSHILIVSATSAEPGAASLSEMDSNKLEQTASSLGYRLALAPHRAATTGYDWQQRLLREPLTTGDVDRRIEIGAVEFADHSDDRPFVYSTANAHALLESSFWFSQFHMLMTSGPLGNLYTLLISVFLLGVVVFVLSLLSFRGGHGRGLVAVGRDQMVFYALGVSSVGLQIVTIYKSFLAIGEPTLSLASGLGVCLFSAGVGAWWVSRSPGSVQTLAPRSRSILVMLTLSGIFWFVLFSLPPSLPIWLAVPLFVCSSLGTAVVFPYLLSRRRSAFDAKERLWLLAQDSLGAALAALLVPTAIESFGLRAVLLTLFFLTCAAAATGMWSAHDNENGTLKR